MSTKKHDIPQIEEIALAKLEIDPSLSGRTEKEIKENAKPLAQLMLAQGGWDARQPGEYFERGGKKHLCAGFTRVAAALAGEFKTGYFIRVEDEPSKLRTACIRTNAGKPISQMEQGRIYASMRDGSTDSEICATFAPMTIPEIAAEIGLSRQHVDACIGIFEETPEIGELIASGAISPNAVVRARQLVKDDGKRLKFVRAAVATAEKEGAKTATMKHLDAVKPDHVPLKAYTNTTATQDAPQTTATPSKAKSNGNAPSEPDVAPEREPEAQGDLLGVVDTSGVRKLTQEDKYAGIVREWSEERGVMVSAADIDSLVARLVEAPF